MYCTKYLIFVSSLCLALVSSLVYSIPAPSSDDDISPAHGPALLEKRWDCEKCPAKTVTDTCTITKTKTCTETETETKTCTLTKTKTDISKIPLTVTDTVTKTCFETKYVYRTATSTKDNTLTHEQTVVNEKTNTVISKQTNTVTDKEIRDVTVTVKVTVTDKVTVKVTDKVTDTVTKTKTTTTTVLPCNKPVPDTPCDSPMFAFVSPESGQVLERNKDFEVKYNITKLTGGKTGFVDDLQFYLVSSDLHCVNQTIARDANTTPTRVCNKSLQYTISACAKVPPGYYAIQVMYNFCDSTSGKDVCVFHECKRGVVVK